jgi:predicted dehydrogenase
VRLSAHVPAIKAASDLVSFKAVYSRSSRTATSFSLDKSVIDFKLDVYHGDDGLDTLLARDDIDAVIIALPIPTQPEIIKKCLEAGKHVLSEKPIGPDVASAKSLIETYESTYASKNLHWRVAENFAHEPSVIRASELIKSGKGPLGPVLYYDVKTVNHVKAGSKYHATEWRTVPQYQGGFLLDGGVHAVAALRVVLGDVK